MKIKKGLILGTSLLMLLVHTSVKAYTEHPLVDKEDYYTKSVVSTLSEEDEVIELLNHNIIVNSDTYTVDKIVKMQNEDVKKEVTKQKKETLKTNNQEYIKKYFGEIYDYEDEKYKGDIPMTNIHVNRIDHGQYQELREKRIEFSNYSKNDLNNIKKEITENNTTYYLIKVDWQIENTEMIDGQDVPIGYKGTMIYQTVVTINNPYEYEVTVTYSGDVSNKEKEYTYTALYIKPEEPIEEIQQEKTNVIPVIIISGIGFGIATLILLLSSRNVVIYNKTDSGYRTIGKFKLSKENKNIVDLSKYNHRISSNMYGLKLKNRTYEKLKGKVVYIKFENITKPVTITSKFTEFII